MENRKSRRAFIWLNRSYIIIWLTPILLCPIPIAVSNSMGLTAYVLLLMAIYWMTEALPIAITSLIPLALFPLFGVMSASEVSAQYAKEVHFLLLASLIVALAFEEWNLHKRIALRVLLIVGSEPRRLMFGFMMTTAFLSMWMINTATTAMMVPIVNAVLMQLKEDVNEDEQSDNESQNLIKTEETENLTMESNLNKSDIQLETGCGENMEDAIELRGVTTNGESPEKYHSIDNDVAGKNTVKDQSVTSYEHLCKGFMLCVPYAANIGGSATLIGSAPQQVLLGQAESLYGNDTGINFVTYMMYAFPGALICVFLAFTWLQWYFIPRNRCCTKNSGSSNVPSDKAENSKVTSYIRKAYDDLGPFSFPELTVLFLAVLLVLLWFSRDPKIVPGWSAFFTDGFVKESTVSVCIALLLFMCPSKPPTFIFNEQKQSSHVTPVRPILLWEDVHKKMPWNVYFLMGGGFALAEACKVSGLSNWLGQQFVILNGFPPGIIALVVTIVVAMLTEITSNTATATIFLPILAELAEGLGVNPLFLMIPASIACAYAFMLPVATPPNAIAFSYGHMQVIDMVKAGAILNITCVLICNASIYTLGVWVFDMDTFPDWARDDIVTTTDIPINSTMCYITSPC